jgi:hypothetical protein
MANTYNRKADIQARLAAEGKVNRMESQESAAKREEINQQVKAVRRDFQQKERKSQIEASNLLLTA